MPQATIHQVNSNDGGVPKHPMAQAEVNELGIVGDRQRDTEHHGGPQRALCLYALEVIEEFAAQGHNMFPGAAGENVTTVGLDWSRVVPGARLRLGPEVEIEITGYATPCKHQTGWFSDGDFNRMNVKVDPVRSRVYAKVLQGGSIRPGEAIELLEAGVAAGD